MKKTFISFIVAMSIAIYSMCGFAVFADVVPNEGGTIENYPQGSVTNNNGNNETTTGEGQQDVNLRTFDGTNTDGTIDITNGVSTTLIENGSKYNGGNHADKLEYGTVKIQHGTRCAVSGYIRYKICRGSRTPRSIGNNGRRRRVRRIQT